MINKITNLRKIRIIIILLLVSFIIIVPTEIKAVNISSSQSSINISVGEIEEIDETTSTNANLFNLGIKPVEYDIDNFSSSSHNNEYYVIVPNNVTSVEVQADLQDSKAKYYVTGNYNDLQIGINTIFVKVIAEAGNIRTYIIYVTRESAEIEEEILPHAISTLAVEQEEENKENDLRVEILEDLKENWMFIVLITAAIVVIILIIIFSIKEKMEARKKEDIELESETILVDLKNRINIENASEEIKIEEKKCQSISGISMVIMLLFIVILVIAVIYLYNRIIEKKEIPTIPTVAHEETLPEVKEESEISEFEVDEDDEEIEKTEINSNIELLETLIYEYIDENEIDIEDISIVIQDLETNQKISINGEQESFAASVYKLPLAIIYYDLINSGKVVLSDKYQFLDKHQENIGVLESKYSFGDYISVKYLLETMIKYSDNSAAHILYRELGGWQKFKKESTKYVDIEYSQDFIIENVLSAEYVNSLLVHIYNNEENYIELIGDMSSATPNEYLDIDKNIKIAQKYGMYNQYVNSVGIIYSSNPYTISIFTELGYEKARDFMRDVNEICLEAFSI